MTTSNILMYLGPVFALLPPPYLFILYPFPSPTYLKCHLYSKFPNIHRCVSRLSSGDLVPMDSQSSEGSAHHLQCDGRQTVCGG